MMNQIFNLYGVIRRLKMVTIIMQVSLEVSQDHLLRAMIPGDGLDGGLHPLTL